MIRKIAAGVLGLLLVGAAAAWWLTAPPSPRAAKKRAAAVTSAALVDESTYAEAERIALMAGSPEEKPLAESALRIADHELALAFTTALRDAEAHPPTLSADALKIADRLKKSQALLDADQQRVSNLTIQVSQAKPSQKDALQDELQLAQSQRDLDQDEVEEANQDLVAAGGDPQQRIEAMLQEHDAQAKARSIPAVPAAVPTVIQHGSLLRIGKWLTLRRKLMQLGDARDTADGKARFLDQQRKDLGAKLENTKGTISELAPHTKNAKATGAAATLGPASGATATTTATAVTGSAVPPQPRRHSHDDAATLLAQTKLITADQRVLTLLDRQSTDQRQLAGIYQQWIGIVALQSTALIHELMLDAFIVFTTVIVVLVVDKWAQRLLNSPKLDRRQIETLRSITRAGLRVLAVVIILLILIGIPGQLGTMIGIVGAGLTVALKDFIVAFFGWLVLMGRNGIRLGDWVEINGVSGEVTELGMFHTVMLETGNWSDAGHPTGRRVTLTNSFAIEGHYFNFSTSGQWLWDELKVVVPAGDDPYPIVDALSRQVADATADSARQAEEEWRRAVPALRAKTFSGTPGVNVKPVVGGVEISVRYITRAHERFQLRAKLYQGAVDYLGGQRPPARPSPGG